MLLLCGGVGSEGSDSDATTTSSTEHLMTREEKLYVLRHTPRQEPQGQESKSWQRSGSSTAVAGCRSCHRSGSVNRLMESGGSNGSGSGTADQLAASCRTLIIHGSLSDESWARYCLILLDDEKTTRWAASVAHCKTIRSNV